MINRTTQASAAIIAAARSIAMAAARGKAGPDLAKAVAAWPAAVAAFEAAITAPDLTRIVPGMTVPRGRAPGGVPTTPSKANAARVTPVPTVARASSARGGTAPVAPAALAAAAVPTPAQIEAAFAAMTPAQQAAIIAAATPTT